VPLAAGLEARVSAMRMSHRSSNTGTSEDQDASPQPDELPIVGYGVWVHAFRDPPEMTVCGEFEQPRQFETLLLCDCKPSLMQVLVYCQVYGAGREMHHLRCMLQTMHLCNIMAL